MLTRNRCVVSLILVFILVSYPCKLFAQAYSKQDIRYLIDYFREYDLKARPIIIAQESRLEELVTQSYEDLRTHKTRTALKKFIGDLYENLLYKCSMLSKQVDSASVRKGFYDPKNVSDSFNALNLESAYLLLRIKILGYLYQYSYNELALNKDILCPLFHIYSTGNHVKSCNEP